MANSAPVRQAEYRPMYPKILTMAVYVKYTILVIIVYKSRILFLRYHIHLHMKSKPLKKRLEFYSFPKNKKALQILKSIKNKRKMDFSLYKKGIYCHYLWVGTANKIQNFKVTIITL